MQKRKLQKFYDELLESYDDLKKSYDYRLKVQQEQLEHQRKETEKWRAQFERAMHTPEYKLDAEAAFSRGVQSARKKMGAWLVDTGNGIMNEAGVSNE